MSKELRVTTLTMSVTELRKRMAELLDRVHYDEDGIIVHVTLHDRPWSTVTISVNPLDTG